MGPAHQIAPGPPTAGHVVAYRPSPARVVYSVCRDTPRLRAPAESCCGAQPAPGVGDHRHQPDVPRPKMSRLQADQSPVPTLCCTKRPGPPPSTTSRPTTPTRGTCAQRQRTRHGGSASTAATAGRHRSPATSDASAPAPNMQPSTEPGDASSPVASPGTRGSRAVPTAHLLCNAGVVKLRVGPRHQRVLDRCPNQPRQAPRVHHGQESARIFQERRDRAHRGQLPDCPTDVSDEAVVHP